MSDNTSNTRRVNGPSQNSMKLECPICLRIPPKEIYMCIIGHSICEACARKILVCPICRVSISVTSTSGTRNYLAESLLDDMTFPCAWKEKGCGKLLRRGQLSAHEEFCKHGPIRICSIYVLCRECQYPVFPSDLTNNEKIKTIFDHFKTHEYKVRNKCAFDKVKTLRCHKGIFLSLEKDTFSHFPPSFMEVVDSEEEIFDSGAKSDIFVLLTEAKRNSRSQNVLAWSFVWLTSEKADPNTLVEVNISIKGEPTPEMVAVWGRNCISDLSWTIKPMSFMDFKNFLMKPSEERPSFPFSVPVAQILAYYIDRDDFFSLSYSFHKYTR